MNYHAILLAQEMTTPLDVSAELANNLFTTNNVWMMLCTALVFIMHLHARDRIWSSQEHCQYLI